MIIATLAAVAALIDPTFLTQAAPPAAPAGAPRLEVDIPDLDGATADPTCGGRATVARQAFCVTTTQAGAETLMDAYAAAFTRQGWIAAGGRPNLVVYVKRKPEGGCNAFQVLAFTAEGAAPSPAAPAWFAFAAIPGDICHSQAPAAQ